MISWIFSNSWSLNIVVRVRVGEHATVGFRRRRRIVGVVILIRIKRLVGSGIYPLADQLLTQVSVPVVLYFIVSTSRNSPSYQRPPVAEETVEAEDEILLVGGDVAALDGGTEVVHPAEAAALPAAEEASALRKRSPPPLPFLPYEVGQHLVLLRRPRPSLYPHLAATRRRRFVDSDLTIIITTIICCRCSSCRLPHDVDYFLLRICSCFVFSEISLENLAGNIYLYIYIYVSIVQGVYN